MFDAFMKRMGRQGEYSGAVAKRQSDMIMDATFKNDIAYRECYIQKHNHFFPEQTLEGYKKAKAVWMGTDKYEPNRMRGFTPIDAKYNIRTYYSLGGDAVDYYLQFRPHEHGHNPNINVGSYIFVPDDLGNYNLWMIVARDDRPQFPQFYILKCNQILKWYIGLTELPHYEGPTVDTGTYFTWATLRTQSSYNSGVWAADLTTTVENQIKAWVPTNNDTKTIMYNERFIISSNEKRRVAWEVSKVEDSTTFGLTKLTFTQELEFDPIDNVSWVNTTNNNFSATQHGYDYDFYVPRSNIAPEDAEPLPVGTETITHSGLTPTIQIGGSFKSFSYENGTDQPERPMWTISYLDGENKICSFDMYRTNLQMGVHHLSDGLVANGNILSYSVDGEKVFELEYSYDAEKPEQIRLRVPYIMAMIGKTIKLSSVDENKRPAAAAELLVEVKA